MNQAELEKNLELSKSYLPTWLGELYSNSLDTQEFRPTPESSFMERYLVFKLIQNSILQCHIYLEDKEVFHFGIELENKETYLKLNKSFLKNKQTGGGLERKRILEFEKNNSVFEAYVLSNEEKSIIHFIVVVLKSHSPEWKNLSTIFQSADTYYSSYIKKQEKYYFPIFTQFKDLLKSKILSYPYKGRVHGVLAHFKMEDMSYYGKIMGEEFSGKLIEEVKKTIQRKLKKTDVLFTLSSRSYIAFLPDCEVSPVVQRFNDVYFKVNSMTLQFKLDFYEIKPSNLDDVNYFDKVFSSELSVSESIGLS